MALLTLTLNNTTASPITYTSAGVTVPANGSASIPYAYAKTLYFDGSFVSDVGAANITISTTNYTYYGFAAIGFLQTSVVPFVDAGGIGTVAALNSVVTADTQAAASVSFRVTGTWVGTLTFQATSDGINFYPINGVSAPSVILISSITTNQVVVVNCGGFAQVQVIATAWTSGTATVVWDSSIGVNTTLVYNPTASTLNAQVVGNVAAGTADSGNGVKVSAVHNTTLPTLTNGQRGDLQLDASGRLIIASSSASPISVTDTSDGSATGGSAGTTSQLMGGIYNTTLPTLTNGQQASLQLDSSGRLIVDLGTALPAGSNNIGSVNQGTSPWLTKDSADGSVSPGTAASFSQLAGGVYNSTPPTLTNGQQAALQVNSSGQLLIQGTMQPLYGSNNQALTITLASLTNGSARGCTAINNSTALFEDALIFVKITTGATITSTGYINIYAYGSVDGGATYTESFGGTDAAITLASPPNAVLIAQINANVASTTYRAGPFSYCRTVGMDRLPQYWGIFVVNESGGTLGSTSTTQAITYQGVNGQL